MDEKDVPGGVKIRKSTERRQTNIIIPIHNKGHHNKCTNYREESLLSLPEKVFARCLERKYRIILKSKLKEDQCGFGPGRSNTTQIFTLRQIF